MKIINIFLENTQQLDRKQYCQQLGL
jgi:hypothetical protein